ncbi:MAG TPA: cytochrome-c peroxidase, partial [Polyangiaceae bacterium]|nr:cytochrome-c peroxidase [Polyangiaceae bacterium]
MLKQPRLVFSALLAAGTGACLAPPSFGSHNDDAPPPATTSKPSKPTQPPPLPGASSLLGGDVHRASRAYPISGGTLIVTRDGTTAVAADPDRGRVFLSDLATRTTRAVNVEVDDEIGRVVEGEAGRVYVVARRGGAVLSIDVASGTLISRMAVCNAPRGLAYDATTAELHVACSSGALVTLDPRTGERTRQLQLSDDLRDVLVVGNQLMVTRFRSAEMLVIDASGREASRTTPKATGFRRGGPSTLAFRAVAATSSSFVVAHQASSDAVLGTGLGAYYGGNCGGSVADTFVSVVDTSAARTTSANTPARLSVTTFGLRGATGPLDIAVSRDGKRTAVVAIGNSWTVEEQKPNLRVFEGAVQTSLGAGATTDCWDSSGTPVGGEAVAVAFDSRGQYIVQLREPAKLILEDKSQVVREISLSTDSRFDAGLALFHLNTGGGISCASCHPEGGVDGHVWRFDEFGSRTTQPLQGEVSKRAPFHWNGDLGGWSELIDEVMMKRMAMTVAPSADQSKALLAWIDTIPAPKPGDALDPASVERGRALFDDPVVACATCHAGPMFTDNKAHDVGTGGRFVAPSLVGVGARAPLMHHGCAR